jgi:hypothetical protein
MQKCCYTVLNSFSASKLFWDIKLCGPKLWRTKVLKVFSSIPRNVQNLFYSNPKVLWGGRAQRNSSLRICRAEGSTIFKLYYEYFEFKNPSKFTSTLSPQWFRSMKYFSMTVSEFIWYPPKMFQVFESSPSKFWKIVTNIRLLIQMVRNPFVYDEISALRQASYVLCNDQQCFPGEKTQDKSK